MKASGVARLVASWVLQSPPAPLNVGSPELADRPAPRRARIRVDWFRWAWKLSRSSLGTTLRPGADEAIARASLERDRMAVAVVYI